METVLCAAVGTASHWHGLEACTLYGMPLIELKNDKSVQNLFALNELVRIF
jgi:hypothetical protein